MPSPVDGLFHLRANLVVMKRFLLVVHLGEYEEIFFRERNCTSYVRTIMYSIGAPVYEMPSVVAA